MNRILSVFCACIAISNLIAVAKVNTKDDIKTRILRLFLMQYQRRWSHFGQRRSRTCTPGNRPTSKADANSDGILSTKEKHALLSAAEQKVKKDRNDTNSISSEGYRIDDLRPGTKPMESPVRRGQSSSLVNTASASRFPGSRSRTSTDKLIRLPTL